MGSRGERSGRPAEAGRGLQLDKVVLLGRTFEEYVRFFGLAAGCDARAGECDSLEVLAAADACWAGREVLDVAAGVSSFCAEANARGWRVTAFDRIYDWSADVIAAQCVEDLRTVVREIGAARTYCWDFYQSPERMGEYRDRAWRAFLADYRTGRGSRYVAGELPSLAFADGQFELSLVSYLLLVYEAQFSYEFHRDSVLELLRVTRGEVRLYPTVTFQARPSVVLDRLRQDPLLRDFEFRTVATDFEFLLGSNAYVSIRRR